MADERKKALVGELELQRPRISKGLESLKRELHPVHQLKKSVRKHPGRWATGSAGAAFLTMRLLRSKKIISKARSKKRGILLKTGKLIFNLARPTLTAFVLKQAQEYAETKIGHHPDNSMLGGSPQK